MCVWREVSLQWAFVLKHVYRSWHGHTQGACLRTTYVRLERGVLAVGICMEECI